MKYILVIMLTFLTLVPVEAGLRKRKHNKAEHRPSMVERENGK